MIIPDCLLDYREQLHINCPLSQYTYMKVGGPADYLIEVTSTDELVKIIQICTKANLPLYILGGGSNTLFTDRGFRGLVIINKTNSCEIQPDTGLVMVDAGFPTSALVSRTTQAGLAGLAPFLGIPGSVGGAVYNNSHYLDQLIGDYIISCAVYDSLIGIRTLSHDELEFAYDHSALQSMSVVILSVTFQLKPGDPTELQSIAHNAIKRRRETQPLTVPSSGCIFKNFKDRAANYPKLPPGIASAGAIIDHAGLKGLTVGGAEVSQVHANFIVNSGKATSQDIIDLANKISTIVQERYDLPLEREVFFINEHGGKDNYMSAFEIIGGTPLYGSIRLGGAKNASYKLMIASLLGSSESRLLNFSHISDVQITRDVIQSLGGAVVQRGERTLFVDPTSMNSEYISDEFGAASRAAPIFIPVLLHRFNKARVPMPGGDKLGKRPLDWHFEALRAMGATIDYVGESIVASCTHLKGTRYRFPKNSHTGTETVIMAGVLAQGKTIIENAALEPEIDDLIMFLVNMGAHIRRREGKIIEIEGVKKLHGTIHRIMSDRNEAVSYACAAIATKGDIIVENAKVEHLEAFLDKLDEVGAGYEIGKYGIRFFYKGPLKAADVVTQSHPGFMTDWQPLWAVLATQCRGISVIHETVYTQRFQYIEHLNEMGVKTERYNPDCHNPEKIYNFNLEEDSPEFFHAVKIHGCAKLKPITCEVKDLRHGATMVLASMVSPGTSRLTNIEQIDRGYEDLDGRMNQMGANIKRVM